MARVTLTSETRPTTPLTARLERTVLELAMVLGTSVVLTTLEFWSRMPLSLASR
jgi:hypothetical protein